MKTTTLRVFVFLAALSVLPLAGAGRIFRPDVGTLFAQEDWRAEFDDICSKTDDAMMLSKDELKRLIERCEKLKPHIEKLDETARKVYLKRLQGCRDLFAYVLESSTK